LEKNIFFRQHEQEIDELESKLNQEKEQTLTELQQKCDAVKELAIKKAKTEEHNLAEGRMNHFKDLFEKQVRLLIFPLAHSNIAMDKLFVFI